MAFSLVGSASVRSATSPATTATVDTTGADLLVLVVCHNTVAGGTPAISDSKSNSSWQPLTDYNNGGPGHNIKLYYHAAPVVGTGHTGTFSTGGTFAYASVFLLAFSGSHASPFEEESGNTSQATTVIQPGSVTPDQNGSLIITALSFSNINALISISGDGFTTVEEMTFGSPDNAAQRGAWDYLIQGSAGAVNPSWGSDTSIACASAIAVFKPAVGGGGGGGYRVASRYGSVRR